MYRCIIELNTAQFPPISRTSLPILFLKILIFMAMRDRERGTVFWSFGYPENIDQTHRVESVAIFVVFAYICRPIFGLTSFQPRHCSSPPLLCFFVAAAIDPKQRVQQ